MRNLILFSIILLSFGSCVTVFNRNSTSLHIHTDKQAEVIYDKQYPTVHYSVHYIPEENTDTAAPFCYGDVFLPAMRSQTEVLNVLIVKDGIEKKIAIKPVHSWVYYANIYPLYGLGFIADFNDPNRFTYPHHIYVDLNDASGYSIHKPFKSSQLEWVINPPFINGYIFNFNYLTPVYSPFGMSTGLNYHYKKNSFLSGEVGITSINTGVRRFRRAANDSIYFRYHSGIPKEHKNAFFFNVMNNHVVGRFDFGYGLSVGTHTGDRAYERYKMADTVLYSANYVSLGCSFSTHYRLSNSFFAGLNYQPQFVAIDNDAKVLYEHLFCLGFSWRLGLLRNKFYVYK